MSGKHFKVGDRVRWRSQSKGAATVKEGEVVQVVDPGRYPSVPQGVRCTVMYAGQLRRTVSYAVLVRPAKGNAFPKLYWPYAVRLESAEVASVR